MNKELKRVYIIGTAGSGKSFLAKRISEKLDIPCYDLDDIFWYKKYTKKTNKAKRKKALARIANKSNWIIEGVYSSWTEQALRKANIVIILDIHIVKLTWRILKRYLSKHNSIHKESLKDVIFLINYAHSYKKGTHSSSYNQHIALVKKHKRKYIILKNVKQVNSFLNKIK